MEPLVTADQLAARMGGVPDPLRVDAVLADSSATVRAYTGQSFTLLTTTDPIKAGCSTSVRLPQRPVQDVDDVLADGEPIGFEWYGDDRLIIGRCREHLMVTYTHGYAVIPDDIVAVTCNVAARALASPPEDAGVMSRSITNYSESFGAVGAAGPAGLFNDERAILNRYRRPGSSARLCVR